MKNLFKLLLIINLIGLIYIQFKVIKYLNSNIELNKVKISIEKQKLNDMKISFKLPPLIKEG